MFAGRSGSSSIAGDPEAGLTSSMSPTGGPADKLRDALPAAAAVFRRVDARPRHCRAQEGAHGAAHAEPLGRARPRRPPCPPAAARRRGQGVSARRRGAPRGPRRDVERVARAPLPRRPPRRRGGRVRPPACTSGERETSAARWAWRRCGTAPTRRRRSGLRRRRAAAGPRPPSSSGTASTSRTSTPRRDDLLDGREEAARGDAVRPSRPCAAVERGKLVARFRCDDEPRACARLALASVHLLVPGRALRRGRRGRRSSSRAPRRTRSCCSREALPPTLAAPLVAAARNTSTGSRRAAARTSGCGSRDGAHRAQAPRAASTPSSRPQRLARVREQALRGADDRLDEDVSCAQPAAPRHRRARRLDRVGEEGPTSRRKAVLHRAGARPRPPRTCARRPSPSISRCRAACPITAAERLRMIRRQPRAARRRVAQRHRADRGASRRPGRPIGAPAGSCSAASLEAVGSERLSTSGARRRPAARVRARLERATTPGSARAASPDEAAWRHLRLSEGAPPGRPAGSCCPRSSARSAPPCPPLGIFLPVMVPEPAAKHGAPGGGGGGGGRARSSPSTCATSPFDRGARRVARHRRARLRAIRTRSRRGRRCRSSRASACGSSPTNRRFTCGWR